MIWLRLFGTYLLACAAGFVFQRLGVPLPWMIGPLVSTGALYASGRAQGSVPVQTRPYGQMIVAATVGTAFTPAALQMVFDLFPLLVGMALVTALMAIIVAVILSRVGHLPLAPALLATLPTSPVEAAVLAERFQFDPGPIVLSQTVRISAVVILVPMAIYIIDGWPVARPAIVSEATDLAGLALLAAGALAGGYGFRWIGAPNPFFLGPLCVASAMTAAALEPEVFPGVVIAGAQIVLGTWLGSTFRQSLFRKAGRLVFASITTTLLLLLLSSAAAAAAAALLRMEWETLVLGAAPGGAAEMALTARFLEQNVALVTAFQLVRIFLFMPNIPWAIRKLHEFEERRRA